MEGNNASELEILRNELAIKDKNLTLAALYGKELLEKISELHKELENAIKEHGVKCEAYEQEKYSRTLQLEAKESVIQNLQAELESQERNHAQDVLKLSEEHKLQISDLNKKIQSLQMTNESLENELSISLEQIKELESLLEESQQKMENSIFIKHDFSVEEADTVQIEIQKLMTEKQTLETEILGLKCSLKRAQSDSVNMRKSLECANNEIEEKECQITSLYNSLEKSKEDNMELQMEIENMKMGEMDPRKKGNSLFAEVEDNRQMLEKQLISLRASYTTLKEQYELKAQQVSKLKMQFASLMGLSSNLGNTEYQEQLQESLASTKSQLDEFARRNKELEIELEAAKQVSSGVICKKENTREDTESGNLFKYLYDESQKKVETMQKELNSLRFAKISLNDTILQQRRSLHRLETEKTSLYSEFIKARVRLEELESENGKAIESKEKTVKVVTEKLPVVSKEEGKVEKEKNPELPLIEKLLNTRVRQATETELNTDKISSNDVRESVTGCKENIETRIKKLKKSVRLADTICIREDDKDQTGDLKKERDSANEKQKKPARKPMVAQRNIVTSGSEASECRQQ